MATNGINQQITAKLQITAKHRKLTPNNYQIIAKFAKLKKKI